MTAGIVILLALLGVNLLVMVHNHRVHRSIEESNKEWHRLKAQAQEQLARADKLVENADGTMKATHELLDPPPPSTSKFRLV